MKPNLQLEIGIISNMTDETFYVTARIGLADYSVTVFPMWDKHDGDSYFTIRKVDQMIGVLHRTSNDRWEWTEAGLSQDEADSIGNQIDAYYD